MRTDADARILWLAGFLLSPDRRLATKCAVAETKKLVEFAGAEVLDAMTAIGDASVNVMSGIAREIKAANPPLAAAWQLLALRTTDGADKIHRIVGQTIGLISSAKGPVANALARLCVWDDVAGGKQAGSDFFTIAELNWRGQLRYTVADDAAEAEESRVTSSLRVPTELLKEDRWDAAAAWLCRETQRRLAPLKIVLPDGLFEQDRKKLAPAILAFANTLFAAGRDWTGEFAIAWLAMLCDPRRTETFNVVLPQVQYMLSDRDFITNPAERRALQDRLDIWWRAARGEWIDSEVSIFRIAHKETFPLDHGDAEEATLMSQNAKTLQPSVVVMPKEFAEERGLPLAWRELRDMALPLVVARDLARIRSGLYAEFPHAHRAIDLLLRDLREAAPVRIQATILLGPPGCSKSRLVRRLGEMLGLFVYRHDGAAAHDATYAGSPKSWSSAQPSVPARAIMMSRTANPIAAVDELEKGATANYNGNPWSSMTPFLERETAARYRETGLDAQLDLSHVNHLCTANSVDPLPAPLRDRMRIIRVPPPALEHLPLLAAQIMKDLAIEDETLAYAAPLATDELEIVGRAWKRERFSLRKLQRLISATLEASDATAPRH
jgi:ATP-dependent Lon protease